MITVGCTPLWLARLSCGGAGILPARREYASIAARDVPRFVLLMGETQSVYVAAGGLIVLAGVYMTNRDAAAGGARE